MPAVVHLMKVARLTIFQT
uniref:Uncharacterized protein n=1 Tax=Rhizophora mucronata TaxID=61149 RepID=A0A2P2PGY3_RHIMU